MLKIYIGYDSRENIAYQVCRHSLQRHASTELEIYPLKQASLRELGLYTRDVDTMASTEFSLTRFLTPYLAAHAGWSIFVDCDFLFTADICGILTGIDPAKAVHVVQHDYSPRGVMKMDGKTQTTYPRKNWSSFMLFNGSHPDLRVLTPEIVNNSAPSFLHRLSWVSSDSAIGALDLRWNFLEGEYPKPEQTPNAIHFTNGGPWFPDRQNVAFAGLWLEERERYLATGSKE
jgi:hypothetical protein